MRATVIVKDVKNKKALSQANQKQNQHNSFRKALEARNSNGIAAWKPIAFIIGMGVLAICGIVIFVIVKKVNLSLKINKKEP